MCRMIDAGEIFARIDSEKSMVRFLEEPEQYASAAMVERLDQCIRCSVALSERVAAAEHAVRPALARPKPQRLLSLHRPTWRTTRHSSDVHHRGLISPAFSSDL